MMMFSWCLIYQISNDPGMRFNNRRMQHPMVFE